MSMSDPVLNCVLEVCCGAAESEALLAATLVTESICDDEEHAQRCAAWIKAHFDLAPAGTLKGLKKAIAKLARGQSAAHG